MTYSVLICDDNPNVGVDCVEQVCKVVAPLGDQYTVSDAPAKKDVQCAIKELFARQAAVLDRCQRDRDDCLFDQVDILILDYDLLYIDKDNARHTGESLARLARTFADVKVIVVYNQYREAHFDLSLRGHLSSHADLNLKADLLGTPGLWTDPPWKGFRPWHWQTLYRAVETQEARQKVVREHFDKPIVEVLGMEKEDMARLSDTAFGFVASSAGDWEGIRRQTFRSFVRGSANDRSAIAHFEANVETTSSFAASRIGKWLDRWVLAPQDALIDLPHLIQFYPFLLGADLMDLDAWNAAVLGDESLRGQVPDKAWFTPAGVLSRPAVWRQRVVDDKEFRASRGAFNFASVPPFVFLEDTSSFVPLDEAKRFRAGHHNAFDGRFVKGVDGFTYAPQRRLAYAE